MVAHTQNNVFIYLEYLTKFGHLDPLYMIWFYIIFRIFNNIWLLGFWRAKEIPTLSNYSITYLSSQEGDFSLLFHDEIQPNFIKIYKFNIILENNDMQLTENTKNTRK